MIVYLFIANAKSETNLKITFRKLKFCMLVGNAETGSVNFGGWNLDDWFLIYCYCKVKNMTEKKNEKKKI